MRTHSAAADPYASVRCVTCGHWETLHDGDRCKAGDHTVACVCEGWLPVEAAS